MWLKIILREDAVQLHFQTIQFLVPTTQHLQLLIVTKLAQHNVTQFCVFIIIPPQKSVVHSPFSSKTSLRPHTPIMSESSDHQRAPAADTSSLPPEAITFATRMYDAARQGNTDLLQQAIDAGLPPNLTNDKGDTLVRSLRLFRLGLSLKFSIWLRRPHKRSATA